MDNINFQPDEVICDGRYEIIAPIGQGGLGQVYKARSMALKRVVAIKNLSFTDEDTLRRFSREAATLAQIDHPTVVKIFDFIEGGKCGPLIVMEYVEGRELSEVLASPMPISEAVDLTLSISSGVFACHRRGIIHRDLKPRNILLTKSADWRKRVKILDFGLAIPFDSPALHSFQARSTNSGILVGTPRFIAPELIRREEATAACDQYSLASILYLALTGRPPFPDHDGPELFHAILQGQFRSAHLLRMDLPDALDKVLHRALHLYPSMRYGSVADFSSALLPFATQKGSSRWTLYFSNVARPVDRKLFEPVSAQHSPETLGPIASRIQPIQHPVFEEKIRKLSPPTSPAEPLAQIPPTPIRDQPLVPEVQPALAYGRNLVSSFALGTIFGAVLAVLIILAVLEKQRHFSSCSQTPGVSSKTEVVAERPSDE